MENVRIQKKKIPRELLKYFVLKKKNRWKLRNEICWFKLNVMPSSVKDRFTIDWESVFFWVKDDKYWFEQQFDPYTEGTIKRIESSPGTGSGMSYGTDGKREAALKQLPSELDKERGRTKRTVWKIPTQPFSEAHFAVFPESLIETPIKAGCPEFICKKCGVAREKILEPSNEYQDKLVKNPRKEIDTKRFGSYLRKVRKSKGLNITDLARFFPSESGGLTGGISNVENGHYLPTKEMYLRLKSILQLDDTYDFILELEKIPGKYQWGGNKIIGQNKSGVSVTADYNFKKYTDCKCKAGWNRGIVLDPFMGSGTTALVARKLGRDYLGIELSENYIKIANKRLSQNILF